MSTCCCSLAGTAACKTCSNNPNADLSKLTVATMIWSGSNLVETIISRPLTNADRIRAMTDEELVFFLWWFADGSGKTVEQWREWLKQECDENGA